MDPEVPKDEKERLIKKVMKERHESLGPMSAHELSVFVCFVTVIVLWFFRRPLFMPGIRIQLNVFLSFNILSYLEHELRYLIK